MYCLDARNIVYRFSKEQIVLNDINLRVEKGSIYGFLGPNGAGKTTFLKLILGLLKNQNGSVSFFEQDFSRNRVEILKRIGTLIESPSLYGHLTARENLIILQQVYQCPAARISEVLDLVGLSNTGNKKINQFSLGMKQRLSIAIAMLHNPELLILDEPTNGLDPNGIIEMRELLRQLNRETGLTIVISSHLLSEIERLVSHIGIINKGRMMFQGTLSDLIAHQQQSLSVTIDTSDNDMALSIIKRNEVSAKLINEKISMSPMPKEIIAHINNQWVAEGLQVYEIATNRNDLEMIFMEMINQ